MKKYILLSVSVAILGLTNAQDVDQKLTEAKTSYKDGKLEDSRFALQQALHEINIVIGKEILKILPGEVGGLAFNADRDDVTGSGTGYAGLYVNRYYEKEGSNKSANILIIADSPMLAGINTILAMPAMMASGDPNQKRIKVDGYKALMTKNESNEGTTSYDVQVPFGNSLLTFNCEGFSNENDVISMVNTIEVSKVAGVSK